METYSSCKQVSLWSAWYQTGWLKLMIDSTFHSGSHSNSHVNARRWMICRMGQVEISIPLGCVFCYYLINKFRFYLCLSEHQMKANKRKINNISLKLWNDIHLLWPRRWWQNGRERKQTGTWVPINIVPHWLATVTTTPSHQPNRTECRNSNNNFETWICPPI